MRPAVITFGLGCALVLHHLVAQQRLVDLLLVSWAIDAFLPLTLALAAPVLLLPLRHQQLAPALAALPVVALLFLEWLVAGLGPVAMIVPAVGGALLLRLGLTAALGGGGIVGQARGLALALRPLALGALAAAAVHLAALELGLAGAAELTLALVALVPATLVGVRAARPTTTLRRGAAPDHRQGEVWVMLGLLGLVIGGCLQVPLLAALQQGWGNPRVPPTVAGGLGLGLLSAGLLATWLWSGPFAARKRLAIGACWLAPGTLLVAMIATGPLAWLAQGDHAVGLLGILMGTLVIALLVAAPAGLLLPALLEQRDRAVADQPMALALVVGLAAAMAALATILAAWSTAAALLPALVLPALGLVLVQQRPPTALWVPWVTGSLLVVAVPLGIGLVERRSPGLLIERRPSAAGAVRVLAEGSDWLVHQAGRRLNTAAPQARAMVDLAAAWSPGLRRVALLGLGDGRALEELVALAADDILLCEPRPALLQAARIHGPESLAFALADERLRIHTGAWRPLLAATPGAFDCLLALPDVTALGDLLRDESLRRIAAALAPAGIFACRLPHEGLGDEQLRIALAGLRARFAGLLLVDPAPLETGGACLLIASRRPLPADDEDLEARLSRLGDVGHPLLRSPANLRLALRADLARAGRPAGRDRDRSPWLAMARGGANLGLSPAWERLLDDGRHAWPSLACGEEALARQQAASTVLARMRSIVRDVATIRTEQDMTARRASLEGLVASLAEIRERMPGLQVAAEDLGLGRILWREGLGERRKAGTGGRPWRREEQAAPPASDRRQALREELRGRFRQASPEERRAMIERLRRFRRR